MLSLNSNIVAVTIILKAEIEQCLKKICQKNKISKALLKKKPGTTISKIKRQLYIPKKLRQWMIQRHHNNPAQRHPGITKTIEIISPNYYFLGIRKKVECYISECQNYQMNKYSTCILYKYIKYIKIADYLWQKIILDFIVKFSQSEDISTGIKYNNILIIIDKLTKYAYFILYKELFEIK